MATIVKVEVEGFEETKALFNQIKEDYGQKDAQNIMRNAVRKSMQPVLRLAKSLVRKDTGALASSLQVETRRPSRKDKNSKYISDGDVVIGLVTTASGKKLQKKSFKNIKTGDKQSYNVIIKDVKGKEVISNDQRAAANEFGTASVASKEFLRPALEGSSTIVANSIGESLKFSLEKYKAKQAKRVKL